MDKKYSARERTFDLKTCFAGKVCNAEKCNRRVLYN